MAHVHIAVSPEGGDGSTHVVVDGVDLSKSILADGFEVGFDLSPGRPDQAIVTMRILAEHLTVDAPEAVLNAVATTRDKHLQAMEA